MTGNTKIQVILQICECVTIKALHPHDSPYFERKIKIVTNATKASFGQCGKCEHIKQFEGLLHLYLSQYHSIILTGKLHLLKKFI